mgnify:CR=1 FL=1
MWPFSFVTPIVWGVIASIVLGGGIWLFDEIGDRREAKVEARMQPQIDGARRERDQWKAAHQKLLDDAERLNAENHDKLKGALAAKAAAEQAAGGAAVPAPRPRGLRKPAG